MKIDIKNGDLVLFKSDTIIVHESSDVSLTFDEELTLTFRFIEDSTTKDQKMEFVPQDKTVIIKLVNFNNPIGTTTSNHIPFATADDKDLYISFAIYSVGKSKVLHYNIYTEQ